MFAKYIIFAFITRVVLTDDTLNHGPWEMTIDYYPAVD